MTVALPEWLIPLLGEREKAILDAPDSCPMQCLPECLQEGEERLPRYQQYIVSVSLRQYFVIDSQRMQIIG